MEKYTMVKTEVQDNGDILVFYMDENGAADNGGVVTIDQDQLQQLQQEYVLEEVPMEHDVKLINPKEEDPTTADTARIFWSDEDIRKLLVFFIDNLMAFRRDTASRNHLWAVACKTMLSGKTPISCERKLLVLKQKYVSVHLSYTKHKVNPNSWAHYDLCHQAFNDDSYVHSLLNESTERKVSQLLPGLLEENVPETPIKKHKVADETMKEVLNLYLQYKRSAGRHHDWQKMVWEKIAIQVGDSDTYWHKRFLNFKQHYIKLLEKRGQTSKSPKESINWPYMEIFDEIYKDDEDFKSKYNKTNPKIITCIQKPQKLAAVEWDETEKTVLVKYCFDCFDEFQDMTIPKAFLWNEVGRLLDKTADSCKKKYEELKAAHLNSYITGGYQLKTRKPIAILFDNIISKKIDKKLSTYLYAEESVAVDWKTEKFDALTQFLFDNIELFKDPVCHFVCWAAVAQSLGESVESCREHWKQLTTLYKSILEEKKEDSELQIDWRYIDIFDRIFDYGMDSNLLEGYEKPIVESVQKNRDISPCKLDEEALSDSEDEEKLPAGKYKHDYRVSKVTKVLDFYMKNKDRFAKASRKGSKYALWEELGQQIGWTAQQCAHRFVASRLKYTQYIQKEISHPDVAILWPYYSMCKKAFGYRTIKNKLQRETAERKEKNEWSQRDLKAIMSYFKHYLYTKPHDFNDNSDGDDISSWADLAAQIRKTPRACRNKFLDLRTSYRRIMAMIKRYPEFKVDWKYYKMFEDIYNSEENMNVETLDETLELPPDAIKTDIEDDDFQCIIVIPEGEDLSSLNNANPEILEDGEIKKEKKRSVNSRYVWKNNDKKELLSEIHKYVKASEGKLINAKEMWTEISSKLPKRSPVSCKNMWLRIKGDYKDLKNKKNVKAIEKSAIYSFVKTILALKPKYARPPLYDDIELKEKAIYTDVNLPEWRIEKALKHYIDHLDEFHDPKYDKKCAWIDLAKNCGVPLVKIFNKINYLKQAFNRETREICGVPYYFADLLTELLQKEFICVNLCKTNTKNIPEASDNTQSEVTWSEDEIEQLLKWYLNNLDKFKNPKYVPSYLWMEASEALKKGPLACSKKMTEIRSQYSSMVKESPDALNTWRFYNLCQKIYGTGKKSVVNDD